MKRRSFRIENFGASERRTVAVVTTNKEHASIVKRNRGMLAARDTHRADRAEAAGLGVVDLGAGSRRSVAELPRLIVHARRLASLPYG